MPLCPSFPMTLSITLLSCCAPIHPFQTSPSFTPIIRASVRFWTGRGEISCPAPHRTWGRGMKFMPAPPRRAATCGAPDGEQGGGALERPHPVHCNGAPLVFAVPRPISGAPPGSRFFAGPCLGPHCCESISRRKCEFPAYVKR